jgi:hypothetical protein
MASPKQALVIIFIFAFTGMYLKYGNVNKLQKKVFDSNFLLLVCRLGRAPRETRMASGWRGYV